ncbi:Vegetative incompatibility protein HET-E-1 [Ceratocystis lukuohia]|uniref:Vegetative incompatibility protein HET-E-1 n=1 Tax=Ceratocystis lukuohia TaxID=2019550 RepID=A0ABR4M9X3_9PEZI
MFFSDKGCTKTCTVWEVANAIAADNISGSIKTGRDEEELIDATYGYKNPCEALIKEAKREFPGREMIILSIGTGVNNVVKISDSSEALATALREIAATSKRSELRLQSDYGDSGVYHRFNVEKGLGDTESLTSLEPGAISAHTRNYIREHENSILDFVDAFTYANSLPLPQAEERAISSFTLPHEEQSKTSNGTKCPPTIRNHTDRKKYPPGSHFALRNYGDHGVLGLGEK